MVPDAWESTRKARRMTVHNSFFTTWQACDMTHILQRQFLTCPYGLAKSYLDSEFGGVAGHELLWHLRAPGPSTSADGPLDLEKDVDVTIRRGEDPMHFDEPWNVTWSPHGGGPFPTFEGTLTVRADESWNVAVLELSGSYKPPLGFAGVAFDALLGARLAAATAKALLAEIGRQLEGHYHRDEAAKMPGA
jgi:hypothetical protein